MQSADFSNFHLSKRTRPICKMAGEKNKWKQKQVTLLKPIIVDYAILCSHIMVKKGIAFYRYVVINIFSLKFNHIKYSLKIVQTRSLSNFPTVNDF